MRICNLASGSTGNSTYVETSKYKILIDLGKTKKYLEEKLKQIGVNSNDIDFVLLTHTHDDHISALKTFLKGHKAKLIISKDMFAQLSDISDLNILIYEDNPTIEGLSIKALKMSHDSKEIRSFIIEENGSSLVYITDTGYINSKYFNELKGKNAYFIESNHDIEMLTHGPYPEWLQKRVLSDLGHLSNKFTGIYLSKLISSNTKNIMLLHLSEKNNNPTIAVNTVKNALEGINIENIHINYTYPNEVSEDIEI